MGKIIGIFACLLIVGLDVVAGILGIKAEVAQNQEKHLRLWIFECKEPSHDAFVLGLGAATLLGIAHVLANLVGGCAACTQDDIHKPSPTKQLSMACLLFTWIIMAVGLSMLVIGILSNRKSRASCGLTHHHFLSIGGIVCMVWFMPSSLLHTMLPPLLIFNFRVFLCGSHQNGSFFACLSNFTSRPATYFYFVAR